VARGPLILVSPELLSGGLQISLKVAPGGSGQLTEWMMRVILLGLSKISTGGGPMPMIDVYATRGMFANKHALAQDLAKAVMKWEKVPDLALFRDNTAAFIHDLPEDSISNAAGSSSHVRVQVLTPVGVLDREKQLGVVQELTEIVASAGGDPSLAGRTWVLITESPDGGWGINGHANTGTDIAELARKELTGE